MGDTGELFDKFKQKFCLWCTFSQFHNHDFLKELIVIKSLITKLSSSIIYLNYNPLYFPSYQKCFAFFYFFAAPTMYGLPYPFPQTYHLGETLQMVRGRGRVLPSSEKNAHFPHQKYSLTKLQFPIQASIRAAVITVVSFFQLQALCTDISC